MRVTAIVWCLLCTLAACSASGKEPGDTPMSLRPSVEEVRTAILDHGPAKVLLELHTDPQRWSSVYRGIASGSGAWMDIGRDLATAADAGWAYDINLAFGEALTVAPKLVLQKAPDLWMTCANLDDPFTIKLDTALEEVQKREKAVGRVDEPSLKAQKTQCLAGLAQLKEALPKGFAR